MEQALQRMKTQRAEEELQSQTSLSPLEQLRKKRIQGAEDKSFANENFGGRQNLDLSNAAYGASQEGQDLNREDRAVEQNYSYMRNSTGDREGMRDEQGNDTNAKSTMAREFVDNLRGNMMVGLGNLVSSYGDMANVIYSYIGSGGDMANFGNMALDGNIVSRFLQEAGGNIKAENENFIPDEVSNAEFKIETFLNPEFWSTHGGQFLPQLAEIAAQAGVGGLVKKGVQKGLTTVAGKAIQEGAERGAIKTAAELAEEVSEEAVKKSWVRKNVLGEVRNVTTDAFERGAAKAGATHTVNKGSGLLGKVLTDKGTLTKGFGELVQSSASGATVNLTVGLKNAGEVFETYKNAVQIDANGQPVLDGDGKPLPLFSPAELGEMASTVFASNLSYMAADMLSWALVYGKGLDVVKNIPGKLATKVGKSGVSEATAVASGMFSKSVSPFIKKLGGLGVKMGLEGAEESVQESFEEWTKMRAYADAHGSLKGYKNTNGEQVGDYATKNYWSLFNPDGGFWDFYKSKDSETTRTIAAALGALAGGAFNVSSVFNQQADTAYKLQDRINNVNKIHTSPEGKALQERDIYRQMSELVMENKGGLFAEYTAKLYDEGKITQEEFSRYGRTYDETAANFERLQPLKMKGKKAFMRSVADEIYAREKMTESKQRYDASILADQVTEEELGPNPSPADVKALEAQKKKSRDRYIAEVTPLANIIAQNKTEQKNLLLDKGSNPVEVKAKLDIDERTGEQTKVVFSTTDRPLTESEKEKVTEVLTEYDAIDQQMNEALQKGKEMGKKGLEKGKSLLGKAVDFVKKTIEPKTENDERTEGNDDLSDGNTESESNSAQQEGQAKGTEPTDGAGTAEGTVEEKGPKAESKLTSVEIDQQRQAELQANPEDSAAINEKYDKMVAETKETASVAPISPNVVDKKSVREFTNNDYKEFKKTGKIDIGSIQDIAFSVFTGTKLSAKQQEVYNAFKADVDQNVSLIQKTFLEEAADGNEDAQTILDSFQAASSGEMNQDSSEEIIQSPEDVVEIEDDPFADGRFKKTEETNTFSKQTIFSKISKAFKFSKEKMRNVPVQAATYFDDDFGTDDFTNLAQSIQVSKALQKIFPDTAVNVYVVKDMEATVGQKGLGFALASQIYIQENQWNQGNTLMHEVSHVLFPFMKGDPNTVAFMNFVKRDKNLVNRVYADYDDSIEYSLPNGTRATKKELIGKNYDAIPQVVRDAKIELLLKEGKISTVELDSQPVIYEELFAAALEGPLSRRYNQYFQEKEPEIRRQFYAKKWWNKVKTKGENFSEKDERKVFFQTLNPDEQEAFQDSMSNILDSFSQEIAGKDISSAGRASLRSTLDSQQEDRLKQIERELSIESGKFLNDDLLVQKIKTESIESVMDEISFETMFDESDRLSYSNKLGDVIKNFAEKFNKGISAANRLNANRANWKRAEYLKVERLNYLMRNIASNSFSGADYIRRLEDSDSTEIKHFMKYLDNSSRGDKNLMLQTLFWHENNTSNLDSIRMYVDGNQNSKFEMNLNRREQTIVRNTLHNITQPFRGTERNKNPNYRNDYKNLINAATNIYSGNYTSEDIITVGSYFMGTQLDKKMLFDANRINVNGKVQPLNSVIVSFVKSNKGLLGNGYVDSNNKSFYSEMNNGVPSFGLTGADGKIKSGVMTFIRSLVNENRKYTARYTVEHADGTTHQARAIDNYLLRGFKQMKRDVNNGISKTAFFEKYGHFNRNQKGAHSNKMLEFFYNKVKNYGDIDVLEFGGILNDYNDGKSTDMKSSDSVTERLGQFMAFMNSSSKVSYMMDLGRFSDSSKAYYTEVPRVPTDDVFSVENGKVKFTKRALLDNILNTHLAMGYDGNLETLKSDIEASISEQVNFINNNISSLSNDSKFKGYVENGKLNKAGKMAVANYEINQIVNGTNFTEIFFPSFKMRKENSDGSFENEAVKRAKSASSPMFSFPDAVKIEPIYIDDIKIDGMTATDAGFFILQSEADKFKAAGGTIMPLGNAYKLLHTGVEYENSKMTGNVYNKGYATIINDEVVAKNPQLKGAYELLKLRSQKYNERHGKPSANLLDGTSNHIPMIVPMSANKSKGSLPASYDKNVMNYEYLNFLAESGEFDPAMNVLDNVYYNNDGDFVGMSGANFGIQQVMDIDKDYTNTSVQFLKSITTNMTVNENQDQALDIINSIASMMRAQIDDAYNLIQSGDSTDIREFFKLHINRDKMDQIQAALIYDDNVSLTTPAVKEIVKNTLSNYLKQNGLKLKTPGNVLREKPTLYKKQYRTSKDLNATTGNDGLNFYQKNSDGSVTKGEAVIPESMLYDAETKKTHKLIPRIYLADNGKSLDQNLADAKYQASSRGVGYGKVFDENDDHVGYYVEGDTIMATRIPSHGVQSTGVFEVVDFTGESGNNIQLPNEFKEIVGSDNDGDQIFVQHKGKGYPEWNSVLKKIEDFYTNPNMWNEIHEKIDFEDDAKNAVSQVESVYGKQTENFILPFSSKGRQNAFKDTMVAKANVGLAANLHTTLSMFRNYNVGLKNPIIIDGAYADQFSDSGVESVTIKSAKIFNIILDNAKSGNADKLGINTNTIGIAMVLSNLNYDLDKVSLILNHPVVKRYAELKDNNISIFNKDEKYNVMDKLKEEFDLPNSVKEINIDSTNPDASKASVFALLKTVNAMDSEITDVAAVLSLHNTMTVNAFEIDDIVAKFDNRVNNVENSQLVFPENFQQNPIVNNYKNILLKNQELQKRMDPVYQGNTKKVYEEIINLSTKDMSKANHKKIDHALQMFYTSQLLGFNNIPRSKYESLVDPKNENNIFNQVSNHIDKLKSEFVYFDKNNPWRSVTALENNILFTKGLNFTNTPGMKYISLNSEFHQQMADPETRKQMIAEFNDLDLNLQKDLMAYDLMQNGWAGPNSLFPLFRQKNKMLISNKSSNVYQNSDSALAALRNATIMNNPELFSSFDNVFIMEKGIKKLNPSISVKNKMMNQKFSTGEPFMFRTKNELGQEVLIKFNGFTESEMNTIKKLREDNPSEYFYTQKFLPMAQAKFSREVPVTKKKNANLDYITIPTPYDGGNDTDPTVKPSEPSPSTDKDTNSFLSGGRAQRRDYSAFDNTLSQDEFNYVMEFSPEFEEQRKRFLYDNYSEEKRKADKLAPVINPETVQSMSNEELLDLFDGDQIPEKFGGGPGFGLRNKFAYASVLNPIIKELARRGGAEQSLLTGREYNGKDISILDRYFMSNNVPSHQPEAQFVVRRMETEYKKFLAERAKYVGKINEATDALYLEQLGYIPNKVTGFNRQTLKNITSNISDQLFTDKEALYKKLYGPLVEMEIVEGENGQSIKNMKYYSPEIVASKHKAGAVSDAQLAFYNATRSVSEEMKGFHLKENEGRKDYIPHSAPQSFEILSRRGLLGLMVNAKTVDEKVFDVRMDIKDPITGKELKGVNFKTITDIYNNLSHTTKDKKYALDYVRLKTKAVKLNAKGINEDGTPIVQSNVEVGTALGDIFMDRFSNGRSVAATDLPTLDLNKAFVDYTHATLFQHGNDNFAGFQKMVPVIDGVIANADAKGDTNISQYVDKVWKEYFVGGRKQTSFKTPAFLQGMGITTDKAIDYITKGSLIYWLGWKGLAIGGGAYAVGNVLVGKFNNVVEAGGKAWLKGEKRFWFGKEGTFDITDPFKGVRESVAILKNTGFMDINIYDDVNVNNKNSLEKSLMSLALMPMSYSEKWIQGVHFLGKLDDQQWASLVAGNALEPSVLTEMENDIKGAHGKGYTPTDQRMIQMYSWGTAMMQFNRYIPTMLNTLFGKEDVNVYGKKTMGAYTAVYKTIQKGVRGDWSPKNFVKYYKNLDVNERKRLNAGLTSFGMISALAAVNTFSNNNAVDKLISDSHMVFDIDRMQDRLIPRSYLALEDVMR